METSCFFVSFLFPCLERVTAVKEEDSARVCLTARKAVGIIYRRMIRY